MIAPHWRSIDGYWSLWLGDRQISSSYACNRHPTARETRDLIVRLWRFYPWLRELARAA